MRIVAVATLVAAASISMGAEQEREPQPQPTFRTGIKLVRVDVSVTGHNDEAIADLEAASFRVTEDGIPQKVETAQFVRLAGQEPPGIDRDLTIRDRQHGNRKPHELHG